jgi:hypothetical protein
MEWLINAFWAKIGWAAGEVAIGFMIAIVIAVSALLINIPRFWRQSRCKHLHYFETSKCDAICRDCRKNLGFIGYVRDGIARP